MKPGHGALMGALAVAVIVLGYLYYQETQRSAEITIDVPNVTIDSN